MPFIHAFIHRPIDPAGATALAEKLTDAICTITKKPQRYTMVAVSPLSALTLGSQGVEGAFIDVRGIGGLGPEVNRALSQAICAVLAESCGISAASVYLNFTEVEAVNWGHNGSTFG